ncbi:ATP-dependent DNA helicase Rep [Marinomonas sp. SBI22]|uniref:DNA helicase Rep n=1 Tax=unclassified Marinomonas TaxID=196814 RepID=UPI0005F9DA83|nr:MULTISPECIES: DNA helicase Rep [unclassified Marinomonas]KJZ13278.1 ATP-dependent DNA helicase Rep [Marinomonas sp. S3726]KZM45751.1 ATP-dependent DNA helicase Rep [Marinomonas sp. SBI22]KZM46269.1 ATP-dependent DNA helicase Rep [Marinomonas sp. SBI8L]
MSEAPPTIRQRMKNLNDRQLDAVKRIDGPLLVLAGAGSGKTSVITTKIAYLIQECGYKASNIVAVTFTNKAAREMKERVVSMLSKDESRGLKISTFHNLGLTILRKEYAKAGLKQGFTLFDSQDSLTLIKEILDKEFNEQADEANFCQMTISNWKNDLTPPNEAVVNADSDEILLAAHVYGQYQRYLRAYNAVDFDDLILLPVSLLSGFEDLRERWQRKVRYLLVDECQDTNNSQYELIRILAGARKCFTLVGDDDQSIYAWRGARPENLERLNSDYKGLKLVKLEQNYRSTKTILKAANTLIANNPHVYDKSLWSDLGIGDPIRIMVTRNEESESDRVAAEIQSRHLRHDIPYKDFAILYRGNHQARLIEIKLQAYRIPYKMNGGTSFFARAEIKDLMSYLRLLVNPEDDNAFLRIINLPKREIGPATLEKVGILATEHKVSLFAACELAELEERVTGRSLKSLREFEHWISSLRRRLSGASPVPVIEQMIHDMDYYGWLQEQSSSPKAAERRIENVRFLLESIQRMMESAWEEDPNAELDQAISKLLLIDMLERQEEEEDEDKVQLLTLHASKGLEYPHVFLIGCEEELLPHRNSIENDDIEEERRLAYVGITRAKRTLCITLASKRRQYGEEIDCMPSRFLDELPDDVVQWEGRGDESDKVKKEQGKASLSALKAMLNN